MLNFKQKLKNSRIWRRIASAGLALLTAGTMIPSGAVTAASSYISFTKYKTNSSYAIPMRAGKNYTLEYDYHIPVYAENGDTMYCVVHGYATDENNANYSVTSVEGKSAADYIKTCVSKSSVSALGTCNGLDTLQDATLLRIIQMMSVVNYWNSKDGKDSRPEDWNYVDYTMAVQSYIWKSLKSNGMYPTSEASPKRYQQAGYYKKLQAIQLTITKAVKEMYGKNQTIVFGTKNGKKLNDKYKIKTYDSLKKAAKAAQELVCADPEAGTNAKSVYEDATYMSNIKYACVYTNGVPGEIQKFTVGKTVKSEDGNFTIKRDSKDGVTATILKTEAEEKEDAIQYTVAFLTVDSLEADDVHQNDYVVYADAKVKSQDFMTAYIAPDAKPQYLTFYAKKSGKPGVVQLFKVDATTKDEDEPTYLPGAEITIWNEDGIEKKREITNADGYIEYPIEDDSQIGTYTFQETAAPEGYQLDPNTYTFTVSKVEDQYIVEGDTILGVYDYPEGEWVQIVPVPDVPTVNFSVHKVNQYGYWDDDVCTPAGNTSLAAAFEWSWEANGQSDEGGFDLDDDGHTLEENEDPDILGQVLSNRFWYVDTDEDSTDWSKITDTNLTYQETTAQWADVTENPYYQIYAEKYETYIAKATWTGSATLTIRETVVPEGSLQIGSDTITHNIRFIATATYDPVEEAWSEISYTVTVDGKTYAKTEETISETIVVEEDRVSNGTQTGSVEVVKTQNDGDPFTTSGSGTTAGGATESTFSKDSLWTVQLLSDGRTNEGETEPYIHYTVNTAKTDEKCNYYTCTTSSGGLVADENNPLTVSDFGRFQIDGLPFGTYLFKEIKADKPEYELEMFYVTVNYHGQFQIIDVNNALKESTIEVIKKDSETGKTVPAAGVAFRVRYLGNPDDEDPTLGANYGRYLPNGSNYNDGYQYVFYTNTAGKITLPYDLEYGNYQLEEIVAPYGYYIGQYDETGTQSSVDGTLSYAETVAIYDDAGNKVDYTKSDKISYNYYAFSVTDQEDHMDGEGYKTYTVVVNMTNNAVKGKIQIFKDGQTLTGFNETVDADGNTVYTPVYESKPLSGAVFGIYAAEDILLEDGAEPPVAYDAATDEEVKLITELITNATAVGEMEESQHITLPSGSEVTYTLQRETSESNVGTLDYLTPTQQNVSYTAAFSRRDEEAGLTYDYVVSFGFEYTAAGISVTDLDVTRTITADDYVAAIDETLPKLSTGEEEASYETKGYANNNLQILEQLDNEYDDSVVTAVAVDPSANSSTAVVPILSFEEQYLINLPEYDETLYEFVSCDSGAIVIKETSTNENYVAVKDAANPWQKLADANSEDYLIPQFVKEAVSNLPELPNGVTYQYATQAAIYVLKNGEEKIVKIKDADGTIVFRAEDGSDDVVSEPEVPDGWVAQFDEHRFMISSADETGNAIYQIWAEEPDGKQRFISCDENGVFHKKRVQTIVTELEQSPYSAEGWRFEMDGVVLTNEIHKAEDQEYCDVSIVNPYTAGAVTNGIGCEVTAEGDTTSIHVVQPDADVYFVTPDGVTVRTIYLGGYTKTSLVVPLTTSLPVITYHGGEVDYTDSANGGMEIARPEWDVWYSGNNWIHTEYHESTPEQLTPYYTIEIASSAASKADAFEITYLNCWESTATVVDDPVSEAKRGQLEFTSVYKTMRFPVSTLVETVTTDENGVATSSLLPLGSYIVRELQAPEGYVASKDSYTVDLEYADQYTPLIWQSVDAYNGAVDVQLNIQKLFRENYTTQDYVPKAGAVFGIYTKSEISAKADASGEVDKTSIPANTLVGTIVTDENGVATTTTKLPFGNYYVKEIKTLTGYELNTDRYSFRLDEENSLENSVSFEFEREGISGKITSLDKNLAEIQIDTLYQIPVLSMTVNGISYSTDTPIAAQTIGNGVLLENKVTTERSTFLVTLTDGTPAEIRFENGASLNVAVSDYGYTAVFTDGETSGVTVSGNNGSNTVVTKEGAATTAVYNPVVAYTGYTTTASVVFQQPTTALTTGDTTVRYFFDRAAGITKALVSYSEKYQYYEEVETDEETGKPVIPDDAIRFSNDQGENLIFVGSVIDPDAHTMEIDLSKLTTDQTITIGEDVVTLSNASIALNGREVKAIDAESNEQLTDGLQTDHITIEGNTMHTNSRTIAVTAANHSASVKAVLNPDATIAQITADGTLTHAWYNGAEAAVADYASGFTLGGGNYVTLRFTDGSVYNLYLDNLGYLEISVDGMITGTITESNRPSVTENDAEENIKDAAGAVMEQAMPMDALSADLIAIHSISTLTYRRANSFVDKIRVEVNSNGELSTDIPNELQPYISKLSATTSRPLSGAKIEIYDANGNVIVSGKTDTDGRLYFERPAAGTYTFKEISAPSGYELNETVFTFTVLPDGSIIGDDTITDQPKKSDYPDYPDTPFVPSTPKLTLYKTDATNAKGVSGAKIEVYTKDEEGKDKLIASGLTDTDGKFQFDKPTAGTYTFKETIAPDGYKLNETIFTFTVNEDGSITGDDTIVDEREQPEKPDNPDVPEETIIIHKTDATTAEGVPGATIRVYDEDGNVIFEGISDENGEIKFDKPKPGTYTFEEIAAPDGYLINETIFTFTVNEDGSITGDDTIVDEREQPEKPDNPDDTPKTGDIWTAPISLLLAAISALGIILLLIVNRKKRFSNN